MDSRPKPGKGEGAAWWYQVTLAGGKALDGNKYEDEDEAENGEAFGGPRLRRCKARLLLATACALFRCATGEEGWVRARGGGKRGASATHDHSVIPGKDGKLIEAGDEVPSSGDVASYEDAKGQDGEGVHRIALGAQVRNIPEVCEVEDACSGVLLLSQSSSRGIGVVTRLELLAGAPGCGG